MEYIVYHVFEHLYPSVDVDSAYDVDRLDAIHCRQALARAARACRAFSRPALTYLWKSLPNDEPLLRLLCTLGIAKNSSEYDSTAFENGAEMSGKTVWNPVSGPLVQLRLGY